MDQINKKNIEKVEEDIIIQIHLEYIAEDDSFEYGGVKGITKEELVEKFGNNVHTFTTPKKIKKHVQQHDKN